MSTCVGWCETKKVTDAPNSIKFYMHTNGRLKKTTQASRFSYISLHRDCKIIYFNLIVVGRITTHV